MSDFETRVLPVVTRHAARWFRGDRDLIDTTVSNAWYLYQLAADRLDIAAGAFAWFACKRVQASRNLPSLQTRNRRDVMDRPECWVCGPMDQARDREPGPEDRAIANELADRLLGRLTDQEREVLVMQGQAGLSNRDMAARLGVSEARASQIKEQIRRKLTD